MFWFSIFEIPEAEWQQGDQVEKVLYKSRFAFSWQGPFQTVGVPDEVCHLQVKFNLSEGRGSKSFRAAC